MSERRLEALFPGPRSEGYSITSPDVETYNCIAWALGDASRHWWPFPGGRYYWPEGLRDDETLDAFVALFASHRFEICEDGRRVSGVEKVALYIDANGAPTHAARQVPSGRWSSKIGVDLEDIEHATPEALEGELYGRVAVFLMRKTE